MECPGVAEGGILGASVYTDRNMHFCGTISEAMFDSNKNVYQIPCHSKITNQITIKLHPFKEVCLLEILVFGVKHGNLNFLFLFLQFVL